LLGPSDSKAVGRRPAVLCCKKDGGGNGGKKGGNWPWAIVRWMGAATPVVVSVRTEKGKGWRRRVNEHGTYDYAFVHGGGNRKKRSQVEKKKNHGVGIRQKNNEGLPLQKEGKKKFNGKGEGRVGAPANTLPSNQKGEKGEKNPAKKERSAPA